MRSGTSEQLAIRQAQVVTGTGTTLESGDVLIEQGRIVSVGEPVPASIPGLEAGGAILLPGFLDLHIHGGGGADTMDATPEALQTLCRTHARFGTTGLLATTMTQSREKIDAALITARAACEAGASFCPDGARVLGIHLEGPYISPERPGAQPREFVRDFDPEEFAHWRELAGETLKLITLAPERPGGRELLRVCREAGIVVSLGHTDADGEATRAALEAGAAHATHLFNAMPPLHHRKPGPIAVFLTDARAKVELIADGHHVAPDAIRLALQAKGIGGVILITDAMAGAGAGDGNYDLGGNPVTVAGGKALLADGTLAGSVLTMAQAALNLRSWCGLDWNAVARLTSGNAAEQMGWTSKGRIIPGADADLTLLTDSGTVLASIVAGSIVYAPIRS